MNGCSVSRRGRRDATLIEDDELADYVVRRMLGAGLPVIDASEFHFRDL
jgi:hypothetical protein